MAASAANTSREVGAVAGVAVLGALVNSQLRSGLISEMTKLHIGGALQNFVVQGIEHGGGAIVLGGGSSQTGLIGELYRAGYAAFENALHDALLLSAGLLAVAALLAAVTLRRPRPVPAVQPEVAS
jgi:hypothetical protein